MAKIDVAGEIVAKHNDAEIIEFLASTMKGVVKNYRVALEEKSPEVLYGNLGDIAMVASVLAKLDKREKERLAIQENM